MTETDRDGTRYDPDAEQRARQAAATPSGDIPDAWRQIIDAARAAARADAQDQACDAVCEAYSLGIATGVARCAPPDAEATNAEERPEDAARRYATQLEALRAGLIERGVPDGIVRTLDGGPAPVDEWPVATALAALDQARRGQAEATDRALELARELAERRADDERVAAAQRADALHAAARLMASVDLEGVGEPVRDLDQTTIGVADRWAEWITTGVYPWMATEKVVPRHHFAALLQHHDHLAAVAKTLADQADAQPDMTAELAAALTRFREVLARNVDSYLEPQ